MEQALPVKDPEEGKPPGVEQSNGLEKASRELNGGEAVPGVFSSKTDEKETWSLTRASPASSSDGRELTEAPELPVSCEWDSRTAPGAQPTQGDATQDLDFDLSSDSESSESSRSEGQKSFSSASDGENEERRRTKKSPVTQDRTEAPQLEGTEGRCLESLNSGKLGRTTSQKLLELVNGEASEGTLCGSNFHPWCRLQAEAGSPRVQEGMRQNGNSSF